MAGVLANANRTVTFHLHLSTHPLLRTPVSYWTALSGHFIVYFFAALLILLLNNQAKPSVFFENASSWQWHASYSQ